MPIVGEIMKRFIVIVLLVSCIYLIQVPASLSEPMIRELKPGIYTCSYEYRKCVATVKTYKTKFSGHCPDRTVDIRDLYIDGKCRYRYKPDFTQRYVCLYSGTACEIVTEKDEIVSGGCTGGSNGMLDIAKQDYLRGACKKIKKEY